MTCLVALIILNAFCVSVVTHQIVCQLCFYSIQPASWAVVAQSVAAWAEKQGVLGSNPRAGKT